MDWLLLTVILLEFCLLGLVVVFIFNGFTRISKDFRSVLRLTRISNQKTDELNEKLNQLMITHAENKKRVDKLEGQMLFFRSRLYWLSKDLRAIRERNS